jgi:hypothetical protein
MHDSSSNDSEDSRGSSDKTLVTNALVGLTPGEASLLALPYELRTAILTPLVSRQTNLINQFYLEQYELMRPPDVCNVNRQLRQEALDLFYATNIFSLDVTKQEEITDAKDWFTMIGPSFVRRLRRLVIESYASVALAPGVSSRLPVRVTIDLKASLITNLFVMDQELLPIFKARADARVRSCTHAVLQAHEDLPWDVTSLGRLLECFDLAACSRFIGVQAGMRHETVH